VELRSLLGCFLFSGDDVFKPLGVLSGGERNRFALARILVSPSNFLLLDEPTNHLDMRAKDVLLEALAAFSGTVVFVSHDRYFIDRLATRVLEVENGTVTSREGNYEDYLRWKAAQVGGGTSNENANKRIPESASVSRSSSASKNVLYKGTALAGPKTAPPKNGASAPVGLSPVSHHPTPSSLKAARTTPENAASIPSSRSKWKIAAAFLKRKSRASNPHSRILKSNLALMFPPPKLSASPPLPKTCARN